MRLHDTDERDDDDVDGIDPYEDTDEYDYDPQCPHCGAFEDEDHTSDCPRSDDAA